MGVAGYIGQKEENVFRRLLEIDTIRGPHSTGVLAVDAKGSTDIVKAVGTPWNLYELKTFDEVMRASLCVLMGHNRWATKGKINRRNAHPFEHDHIIGAHNGTLRAQYLLVDHKNFEVDSDNIFHSMAKVGVDETIANTNGAFALTWYDAEQETMNFIRNDERPLYLVESADSRTVFWASEPWMLDITLNLAGIKCKDLFQPKPGELYTYPIELAYVPKAFKEVKVRNLELHKWPVAKTYTNHHTTSGGSSTTTVFDKAKEGDEKKSQGPKQITPNELVQQGEVEFFVSSLQTSKVTGQQWLVCLPTQDNCDIELRLYNSDPLITEWMMNSTHYFRGKVRGYATQGGETWATLDPRTIIEVPEVVDDTPDDKEMAVVFGGQIVTEDEFDFMTICGCGNCKTCPTIEESDELVWLDRSNFICGDCKDLPVVKDFIEKAVTTGVIKH